MPTTTTIPREKNQRHYTTNNTYTHSLLLHNVYNILIYIWCHLLLSLKKTKQTCVSNVKPYYMVQVPLNSNLPPVKNLFLI